MQIMQPPGLDFPSQGIVAPPSEGAAPRVLLAQGDPVGLMHLSGLLNKIGYEVISAKDGLEALAILEVESPPTLAVLDWSMPGLNGLEVCRRLRNRKRQRSTYTILLTSLSQQNDRVEGLEAGADDCLYKPVDPRELRIRLQVGAQIILERALRESEERFHNAFEYAGIGMAVIKTSGEFQQTNRALRQMLGHTDAELCIKNFHDFMHPEDSPSSHALLQNFLDGNLSNGEFERRFITSTGQTAWTSLTLSLVLDTDDHPTSFVFQAQDITQRKQEQEALRRSAAWLRTITDNVEDLILVCDAQYKWLYASPSFFPQLGYTPEELLSTDTRAIVHPEDRTPEIQAANEALQDGKAKVVTFRYRHKNGSWRHVEANRSQLRNAEGTLEGFVVVGRIVDERILAEQKLRAAHAETELFLASIPSIVIGLDSTGQITRWNRTAANGFGLDESAVMGRPLETCGIRWLNPRMKEEITHWLSTADSYRCSDQSYEKDGRTRFLGLHVRRIPAGENDNPGFIVTGADITERKGLEEQLRQGQKLEAIGQLAAGIAHEINTPTQYTGDNLRFLKDSWDAILEFLSFCEIMQQEALHGAISPTTLQRFDQLHEQCDFAYLKKEIPHAMEQSLEGLQRVSKIVRGMKEFSHPGSREKAAINLNRAIETTITITRNEWKYCADLVTDFDESLPLVPCLMGEFNQVILNLIINAAHSISSLSENGGPKGRITITTRRDEEWAAIHIADTGAGIPEEIRARVFEPFFTTKEVGRGTGQGLALAHTVIVNQHQGQIWFDSQIHTGTTFHIRLPLDAESAAS